MSKLIILNLAISNKMQSMTVAFCQSVIDFIFITQKKYGYSI